MGREQKGRGRGVGEGKEGKYWKTLLEDNELFSDRVCSPCAHKILYELVLSSIGSGAAAFKTPPKQRIMKRIQAAGRNAAGAPVLVASLFVSTMLKLLASLNLQAQLSLPSKP